MHLMKKIKLTQGKFALVDDEDFEKINQHQWWYSRHGYAMRTIHFGPRSRPQKRNVSMHRELLGLTHRSVLVDHVDGNKLDNTRANLRLSTKSTNGCNRGPTRKNKSGYKGVYKHPQCNRWQSTIRVKGKTRYLGLFKKPQEAALAYNKAALQHFGEYALLNDV